MGAKRSITCSTSAPNKTDLNVVRVCFVLFDNPAQNSSQTMGFPFSSHSL